MRKRVVAVGLCPWCGVGIPEGKHVCSRCDGHRDWVLLQIRRSPRLARYVEQCEAREAPKRGQPPPPLLGPSPVLPPETARRLDVMEALLTKLSEALL